MKKTSTQLGEIKLLGITARTNNKDEMNPETAKIGATAGEYWSRGLANEFQARANPGVTYAVYTDFESDENGEYTYFIGEAVESFDGQDTDKFTALTIPASNYQKFTTEPAPMPKVVIDAWQSIWQMKADDFGGARKYIADFEVYDQRASNSDEAVIDIYIGVER